VPIVCTDARPPTALIASLQRAGVRPVLCDSTDTLERSRSLVVCSSAPFGIAAQALEQRGWKQALRERILAGHATLAIGTAMQLFAIGSEESPGVRGLGILELEIRRFDGDVRVPQLGWNIAVPEHGTEILQESYAFFSNAYRMQHAPKHWHAAWSEYDGPFIAALECGPVVACQFHPELSGKHGLALIRAWLAKERVAC
jgi:imidazole glycerol phosphate synthase glutamine amidotransferase subunit